jgi:site-specific DNA-cytosine methylase
MRVLVACEFSGVVRRAFAAHGVEAWSCDLLPADDGSDNHIQGDVMDIIHDEWDMMVAHPPCTHLAVSGARWFYKKKKEQAEALGFVQALLDAPIEHIALENPVSVISTAIRKPDQIVQPFWFGDEATKTTCLWLKNLPHLTPTNMVGKGERHITKGGKSLPKWYNLPPSEDRSKLRSVFFTGMAEAMADQWTRHYFNTAKFFYI